MILYKIEFEVDNGASYTKDTAIVVASTSDEAKRKLKEHISSLDSETCVSRIFQTQKFCNEVFTMQHGKK